MNLFDVLIVAALVAGSTWGFIKGVIHQAIGLGSILVAFVVATLFYTTVSPVLGRLIKVGGQGASALSFLLLLIVTASVIGLALHNVSKLEFRPLRLVNQLGGMTAGFLLTGIWVALIVALLYSSVGTPIAWYNPERPMLLNVPWESLRQATHNGLEHSALVDAIMQVLAIVLKVVAPIVPTDYVLNVFAIR